jgi:isoleucyl-tRNA synthetase
LDYLQNNGWAIKIENYSHRYPVCWRCKAELVWKVTDEWYIAMDRQDPQDEKKRTLRQKLIGVAKKIKWIPEFGLERELDWLTNMQDWLISKKNRFWGLALPIWECTKCGNFEVIGSKAELKKRAVLGWQFFAGKSPHKPQIDEVKISCSGCNKEISRIEPVGNPWLDAGIVSFSTVTEGNRGEPLYFKDRKKWKEWFPADFITESFPGQFKNWFYSLIVMATVLEDKPPFKTVLGYASLLGEDGRPMHKSLGNAIEFNEAADKIGVDVMRFIYVSQNPELNLLFGYKKADETRRLFHLLLWNVYNFFVTYANADNWTPGKKPKDKEKSKNILDKWILSRLHQLIKIVTDSLDSYDPQTGPVEIAEFVKDLSTWYVRRSRDRVGPTAQTPADKNDCYSTLYEILVTLTKILAPFTPFLSEEIYKNLTAHESVHLTSWPVVDKAIIDTKLNVQMSDIRKIVELAHAQRKAKNIKVRQPLPVLTYKGFSKIEEDLVQLIKEEVNVKQVIQDQEKGELQVELETKLTPELIAEGKARELVRQIQLKRKERGCKLTDKIKVTIPWWPESYTDYIKKETLSTQLAKGKEIFIKVV